VFPVQSVTAKAQRCGLGLGWAGLGYCPVDDPN
jgi:hypothetical protein